MRTACAKCWSIGSQPNELILNWTDLLVVLFSYILRWIFSGNDSIRPKHPWIYSKLNYLAPLHAGFHDCQFYGYYHVSSLCQWFQFSFNFRSEAIIQVPSLIPDVSSIILFRWKIVCCGMMTTEKKPFTVL